MIGYWPSSYWCTDYWMEDYWTENLVIIPGGIFIDYYFEEDD